MPKKAAFGYTFDEKCGLDPLNPACRVDKKMTIP
jgi:hypothetical protein